MLFLSLLFSLLASEQNDHYLMTTPLQGSLRRVVLADAYTFGVTYRQAMYERKTAYDHKVDDNIRKMIVTWGGEMAAWRWEQEMEWRHRCWDALEDALNYTWEPCQRLRRLETLYDLLGEDAFNSRWMPTPTPNYRR